MMPITTASQLNPEHTESPSRPRPLNSITASAQRITSERVRGTRGKETRQSWQEDAWEMYDLVGEERFLATTLAGRMSQTRFYVGQIESASIDDPDPVEDPRLASILEAMNQRGDLSQIIYRLGVNLFIPGDAWVAGIPTEVLDQNRGRGQEDSADRLMITSVGGTDQSVDLLDTISEATMDQLEWMALSLDEVTFDIEGNATIKLDDATSITVQPDEIFLIRVWRPHPRRQWEADSPTRSSLPVLRELVGLTMHISAQIDSRLAGAGLLLIPSEASDALKAAMGLDVTDEADPFSESLMQAMITPISDRGSAAAVVPLTVTVPGSTIDQFRHISFSQELDGEARELREEAIRRLALGQDAPPELLLGMASMNHWGAWLVREDVVTTHLEPPLALICDALTTQYLWPMMEALGYSPDVIRKTVIWYDVSKLIVRPDRANDAGKLFDRGVLNARALRDANGFDESDAPEEIEQIDAVTSIVIDMLKNAPSLAISPGIPVLHREVAAMLDGGPGGSGQAAPTGDIDSDEEGGEEVIPDTKDDDFPTP